MSCIIFAFRFFSAAVRVFKLKTLLICFPERVKQSCHRKSGGHTGVIDKSLQIPPPAFLVFFHFVN